MADPITAGIAITAVAGAVSAGMQGVAASQNDKAESQAAKYNATADINAGNQASNSAAANEQNSLRRSAEALGTQAAGFGEANIGTGGSTATTERQSATNARLDALNVWYGGELEHRSALNAASLERYQQLIHQQNESTDLIAGGVGAGTSIATGAAKYGAYQKYGLTPSTGTF